MPNNNFKIIAGIDDATKCPCIGSIFVAGVAADKKTIARWKKLGVRDSKLVYPKKRERLAKIIKETSVFYSIRDMNPEMIDDKSFNLNDWEMLTVFKIIGDLQRKFSLAEVYIDNWEINEECFWERFKKLTKLSLRKTLVQKKVRMNRKNLKSIKIIPEHRADFNYTIVGAASILAKTSSDEQYRKLKKIYGDFGSGSPGDPATRFFVWKHRKNPPPIVRKSWNTYKTLSRLRNIEDDYFYKRKKQD